MQREDAEIVIAGGGPAGAACAALLARQGRRVMVLEEKRFPRDKVCGECLSGAALDALARLDLADQVTRRSVELTRLRISARGGTGKRRSSVIERRRPGPFLAASSMSCYGNSPWSPGSNSAPDGACAAP